MKKKEDWQQVLKELQAEYLESFPGRIERIEQLFAAQDWKSLNTEYHKLKGTGKTYGFPEVSEICARFEELTNSAPPEDLKVVELGPKILSFLLTSYQTGQSPDVQSQPWVKQLWP